MTTSVQLSPFVRTTQRFQDYALVNKALLEIIGVDIPMIGLARNAPERKEIIFRQAIILACGFLLAPLHAWAFRSHYSRALRFPEPLMKLPYKSLLNSTTLKKSLNSLVHGAGLSEKRRLQPFIQKVADPKTLEALRQKVLTAKTRMLRWDLMVEGLIFGNLGFIKNAFGRLITGKKQFTGEMGVVKDEVLDQLYEKREKTDSTVNRLLKQYASSILAVVSTPLLAFGLKKAYMKPQSSDTGLKLLRRFSHFFDYKRGLFLGFGSILLIGILNDIGDVLAARSIHERREMILKRVPVTISFFFGDFIWMSALSKLFGKQLGVPMTTSVTGALERAPKHKQAQAGLWASRFYLLSFLLNTLSVSAVIIANNRLTTRKVKAEAAELNRKQSTKSLKLITPSIMPIPKYPPLNIPKAPPIDLSTVSTFQSHQTFEPRPDESRFFTKRKPTARH